QWSWELYPAVDYYDNTTNGTGFWKMACSGLDTCMVGVAPSPGFSLDLDNVSDNVGSPFYFTDDNWCQWCDTSTGPPRVSDFGWSRDQDECLDDDGVYNFPACQNLARWLWDFGDGSTVNIVGYENADTVDGLNHSYPIPGNYTVWLTVWDDEIFNSLNATVNLSIQVINPPPLAWINGSVDTSWLDQGEVWAQSKDATEYGSLDVVLGDNITFNGSLSFDQDEFGYVISLFEWDFNDSNVSCPNYPTQWSNSSLEVDYHSFCEPGVYNVTLFVEDEDNNTAQGIPRGNDSTWFKLTANNLDPVVFASAWNASGGCSPLSYKGLEGNDTLYSAVIGEPIYFCDNYWIIDEGDNVSADRDEWGFNITSWNWSSNYSFASDKQYPVYVFLTGGLYNVSLNVTDDEGSWNSTWFEVNITDSCGEVCTDDNLYNDTCGSNCNHVCRFCDYTADEDPVGSDDTDLDGLCSIGDCGKPCSAEDAQEVCVNGCNYCDTVQGFCVGRCDCENCEVSKLDCPSEGLVAENFTVNYTTWGASRSQPIGYVFGLDVLGWYFWDEALFSDVEASCWEVDNPYQACVYENRTFETHCPYGGPLGVPMPVNFSLNCSGFNSSVGCAEIVTNPTIAWQGSASCTVDCFDPRSDISLYFNATCNSSNDPSYGFTNLSLEDPKRNPCFVHTNATYDNQSLDFECTAGPGGECYELFPPPPNDCSGSPCWYALEGNITLFDVAKNGVYWWYVNCSCDYVPTKEIEYWNFTIERGRKFA
ncbi:MAG: PKD domain-containing protein, partial [Candidatus Altiarchaeota archaeon]